MAEKITSLKNPKIAHVRKLISEKKYRDECKEFIVEGPKVLVELNKERISYVLITDKDPKATLINVAYEVPNTLLTKISDTETPQGIIAVVKQPEYSLKDIKAGKWIIAEGIQDPGNLGTIIRIIEASGAKGLIYTDGTVDPYAPKVVRASAGSVLRIPLIKVKTVTDLKKTKPEIKLIASKVEGGKDYKSADFSNFCGIILGCEGQGMSKEAGDLADETITIPLAGKAESLNVATAAAILLFQ